MVNLNNFPSNDFLSVAALLFAREVMQNHIISYDYACYFYAFSYNTWCYNIRDAVKVLQ